MVKRPEDNVTGFRRAGKSNTSVMPELMFYLLLGLIPMFGLAWLLVGFQTLALSFSFGVYLLGSLLIILLMRLGYPHTSLGFGNLVTMGRFVAVAALSSSLLESANLWLVVFVALISLIFDGVDGYLARKEGKVSDFGARLDMEVDSALGLLLALNLWLTGIVGPIILLLGLPRYFFVATARVFPWLRKSLPYSFSRRVISVVQIASLIGLHVPFLPNVLITPVAWIVAGLLIWSFSRDIAWLWRSRS